jgi:HPt (histidine-containing phosphotransfer) domain-containing protein
MKNKFQQINTSNLDAISGNDIEFQKELIDTFLIQIQEFISHMQQFFLEKKWEKLAKEAHTAKSSVMIFGMTTTGKLLKNIQKECMANNINNISQMTEEAIRQLTAAIPELKKLKQSL